MFISLTLHNPMTDTIKSFHFTNSKSEVRETIEGLEQGRTRI
jgi:hypothetical protein